MVNAPAGRVAARALLALTALVAAGCGPGMVYLRADGSPGPEPCPERAIENMKLLHLRMGDAAWADLDANQSDQSPISLTDGPIESVLTQNVGWLGIGTRLFGQVWVGGPTVIVRYYEARLVNGERVKICAVVRMSHGNMRKLPGSKPGVALLEDSANAVWFVDEFR